MDTASQASLQTQLEVLRLSVVVIQRRRDADCQDLVEALTQVHQRLDNLAERVRLLEVQLQLFQGLPESTDSDPGSESFLRQLD